jgi:inosine/xanthosine triphosphate pyrophosphatase family protein
MKKETFKKLFELRDDLIEHKKLHQELIGERKKQYYKDCGEIKEEHTDWIEKNVKAIIESGQTKNVIHTDDGLFNRFVDLAPGLISKACKEFDKKLNKYHRLDAKIYDQVISNILDIIAGEAEWASLEDNS